MSVSAHASPDGRRWPARRGRHAAGPGDAEVLDRLPDSDFLTALWNLPDDLRLAVYLADVAGRPYREIAEIMGTPISTVTARLHRARRRLRDMLAACAVRRGLAPR